MFDSRMATTPDAAVEPPGAGLPPPECRRHPPFERIALALQGGGALGAYQAGVYQALAEADLHPDWVAGISIGAINAAIIAGNPPASRVDKLREFWELVSSPQMQWLGHSVLVPNGGAMEGNRPDVSPLLKGDVARSLAEPLVGGFGPVVGRAGVFHTARSFAVALPGRVNGGHQLLRHAAAGANARATDRFRSHQRRPDAPQCRRRQRADAETSSISTRRRTALDPSTSWRAVPCRPAFRQSRSTASTTGMAASSRTRRWAGWWMPGRRRTRWSSRSICGPRGGSFPAAWRASRRGRRRSSTPAAPARSRTVSRSCSASRTRWRNCLPSCRRNWRTARRWLRLRPLCERKVGNLIQLIYHSKEYEGDSKDYEFSRRSMEDRWRAGYHDTAHAAPPGGPRASLRSGRSVHLRCRPARPRVGDGQ